jgi:hypothetical protein
VVGRGHLGMCGTLCVWGNERGQGAGVMRRTSTPMTSSSGDVTVKFDDVEHLGNYIQVCVVWGGGRQRVQWCL